MYDSNRKRRASDNELNQGTVNKKRKSCFKSSQPRRASKSSDSDEQNDGLTGVPRRRSARIAKRNTVDYKGVPEPLRKFKWLYIESALTDEGRIKIIKFLTGKYTRKDVEKEDVLLTTAQVKEGGKRQIEESVFRMFFDTKRWRRVSVRRSL